MNGLGDINVTGMVVLIVCAWVGYRRMVIRDRKAARHE